MTWVLIIAFNWGVLVIPQPDEATCNAKADETIHNAAVHGVASFATAYCSVRPIEGRSA